jgi:hypothetical protein
MNAIPGTYTVTAAPVVVGTSTYYAAQATLTVSVTSGSASTANVVYSTIIPNTTKVLDATGMSGLTVSTDGSTVTLPASSPVAASLSVGDVLASAPTTAAPNGLLVKIVSVSTSGGTVTASVQQAALTDAIQQATFQFTEALGPTNTTPSLRSKSKISSRRVLGHKLTSRDLAEASSVGTACARNLNTISLPIDLELVGEDPSGPGEASLTTLQGAGDYCPSFNFALQIQSFQLVSANATITLGVDLSITAGDEGGLGITQNLQSIKGPLTTALIGGVPVTIQPTLTPFVGLKLTPSANISAYTLYSASSIITVGVSYANGQWSPIGTVTSPAASPGATSVDAPLTLKGFVGLQAGAEIYGVVTPYLSTDAYLQFVSSLTASPCWSLNFGIEGNVGVNAKIFGLTVADYSSPSLNLYNSNILQSSVTCFTPVLDTVTPNQALPNSPDLTIALTGSNFVPDSVVNFNGQPLTTTFTDPSDLTAVIPAIDLEQAGAFPVTVNSPDPPGGTSVPLTFEIKGVTVTLSTTTASVPVGVSQLFAATVKGTTNTAVTWSVNGIAGGNSTFGTITEEGVYTAPGTVPNPSAVVVTAISKADLSATDSASVTVSTANPTYFNGDAFVSPDTTVCDYPAPWTPATPPCKSALQSGTSTADLSVSENGASSVVGFDGSNFSVGASTTSVSTENRADAVGSGSYNYVLTSTTIAAGTPVSLTGTISRTGSLSADTLRCDIAYHAAGCGHVTAQETFMINIGFSGVLALSSINQGERVYPEEFLSIISPETIYPPYTESSLADSSVFTFGISGNKPVLLSEPNIIYTVVQGSIASYPLGTLTVNFTVPVGMPFGIGLFDGVNTHGCGGGNLGCDGGNGTSTGVIPAPQLVLPPGVVLHNQ